MGADNLAMAPLFQGGWFVFGTLSQVLVVHLIRTQKIPFVQSRPATVLMLSTLVVTLVGVAVAFSGLGVWIGMVPLPLSFVPWLALLLTGYFLATLGMKQIYIKREGEWL